MDGRQEESTEPAVKAGRRGRLLRRLGFAVGALAVIAGTIVLGVSGFQRLSADESAAPVHPVINNSYDPGGVYDRPLNNASTPSPAATDDPIVVANPVAPPPPLRDMPYRLVIDKIGVNAPVGTYGLGPDAIPDVPSNGKEVAWYDFSARPGTGNNAVFAGHVTWSGRGVFYNLDELSSGDEITLLAKNGEVRLTYTVEDVFLVNPDDANAVNVMMPTPGTDQVTLITCGGDPYYVGGSARYDYTHRLIVRASFTRAFTTESGAAGG
jgi:LPXTG-site transpeptidase (sortase) family protein